MRTLIFYLLVGLFCLLLVACQNDGSLAGEVVGEAASSVEATPSVTVEPVATEVVVVTPPNTVVKIWGPVELSPQSEGEEGQVLREQIRVFEASHPGVEIVYEPKPVTGAASVLNYASSARAVANSVLPDLVILPSTDLKQAVQAELLFPLDDLVAEGLRNDFYTFATRDVRVDGKLFALPLTVQVEHGLVRDELPQTALTLLEELLNDDAPTWLFTGQALKEGEMSNALLLQLISINEQLPTAETLPSRDKFVALFTTLHTAQQVGTIPRQVLSLDNHIELYERLRSGQADLIESNSRQFMLEREREENILFTRLPTLTGVSMAVIDGYVIAISTEDPNKQQTAILYLKWMLEASRLAEWNKAYRGLPPRRSSLKDTVEDEIYRTFLAEQLENGWLRPSGTAWHDFAQIIQEQFRAVMLEQISPTEAVDTILGTYEQ